MWRGDGRPSDLSIPLYFQRENPPSPLASCFSFSVSEPENLENRNEESSGKKPNLYSNEEM